MTELSDLAYEYRTDGARLLADYITHRMAYIGWPMRAATLAVLTQEWLNLLQDTHDRPPQQPREEG